MSRKPYKRTPRHYDGNGLTSRPVGLILQRVLGRIGANYRQRPDLILAAWPEIIGSQLSPMTQALTFIEGVLVVRVKNSTLHSLLSQRDKPRILKSLREKFPGTPIHNVVFKLG